MQMTNQQEPNHKKSYWILTCAFVLGLGAMHLYHKAMQNKNVMSSNTDLSSITRANIAITDREGGEQRLVCNNSEIRMNDEKIDKANDQVVKQVMISNINDLESNSSIELMCFDLSIKDAAVVQTTLETVDGVQKESALLLKDQESSNADKASEDTLSKSDAKEPCECEKHRHDSGSSASKKDCSCDKESSKH